ncbi:GNAT family N-acetyltransferase [Chitinophaga tropicalis]|uniref:GNAT family N-acetyltransferase n=1 Tax=Chitinophaga tropicalis TaxID=2683588 RepID=A0A7K1U8Q5_9BACT|nr:GNAT family N-acetyltransferase [Chitinophaga tropicalis]MVT10678.1 GNAT family N-acetyltransferase [Chitinophaga tropicalis]
MPVNIRHIEITDNQQLANIIRITLEEFNIPKVGTVYSDPETDTLYEVFQQQPGSVYFVAEEDGVLLGGCGVFPTQGLPEGCAELVKYYLTSASRGKGLGKILMDKIFIAAKELGYQQLYLESFPDFSKAVSIYEKAGFRRLDAAMGNSGHYACNVWMLKDL